MHACIRSSHLFIHHLFPFRLLFTQYQSSCIAQPSAIQEGVALCTWDKASLSCSLTPPPEDPVFIILVALITMLFVVPIATLMNHILEHYARKSPYAKEIDSDSEITFEKAVGSSDSTVDTTPVKTVNGKANTLNMRKIQKEDIDRTPLIYNGKSRNQSDSLSFV